MQALISLCGQDAAAPNVDAAATNFSQWSFEHGKLETMLAQNSANFVSAADLRLDTASLYLADLHLVAVCHRHAKPLADCVQLQPGCSTTRMRSMLATG